MKAVGNEGLMVVELDGVVKEKVQEDNKSENKRSETSEIMRETSKAQMNSIPELDREEEEEIKFEVEEIEDENEKQNYMQKQARLQKLLKNETEEDLEIKMFKDPVFEEPQKEEEEGEKVKIPTHLGNRDFVQIPIYCNSL